ncbi:MAG: ABC transporter ATP-binding protein [Desulfobulbaceae bacterium]|nr:ABC transporter ATP-binding protein [Desulfobulbaceae bacterium]
MIELSQISKVFNGGQANEYTALAGISLRIQPGLVTVLKGASGSGKTTLLSIIGCMDRPTSGRLRLAGLHLPGLPGDPDGIEVSGLPERFLTEVRRRTFGFVFQQFHLLKGLSVLENIMLPAYPIGEEHALLVARAQQLLEIFNLSRQAAAKVEWLSGGEAQRVAIARALMNEPAVIIADEPTAHLDSQLSREFMAIIARLKAAGKTAIIASHDPLVYEAAGVDRVITMRDGRLAEEGTAEPQNIDQQKRRSERQR